MSQALTDLLEGRLERLQRSEIGELPFIDQPHRILAIRAGRRQTPSSVLEWSLGRLADNEQLRIPHGVVGGFVVFFAPQALGDGSRTFADRLLAEAKRVAGSEVVLIESHACADISDYSAAWRQILRLSEWAVERGRYGKISTADSGSFGLLAGILDYRIVEDFCGSVLKQIHEHDRTSSTPLFPTIVSLVKHGGRLQPAAAETGMHITTIRYRVERIKELFGLDLRDGDARFTLDMAIRLDALFNVDAGARVS